jgi:Zn-dependent protease with chaperone function
MRTISIGRDVSNNIVLNDITVSRKHAQLMITEDGRVLIKDLGSSNGTFINGSKISEQFLNTGDVVKCGSAFLNWALALNENQNSSKFLNQNPDLPSKKNLHTFSSRTIYVSDLLHEKEKTYFIIKMVFSILIWLPGFILILIFGLPLLPIIGLCLLILLLIAWIASLSLKAVLFGNSVRVNIYQYPELHKVTLDYCQRLGLVHVPELFICNSNGLVNAFAIRFYSKKYVLLMSSLVDLMLATNNIDALSMIIGHEIGHHAAGHTNFWKNIFLKPASIIPFLGAAYSRACEYTADRIGFVLADNLKASQIALVALALGSERLLQTSNIDEFCNQENDIPDFMGFIQKIYSGHPRITKRIIEITSYSNKHKMI